MNASFQLEDAFIGTSAFKMLGEINEVLKFGKKVSNGAVKLLNQLKKSKTAFVNADEGTSSTVNSSSDLIYGDKALKKYKSINVITHKGNSHGWLDSKIPPLSRFGIGEIPSSSDIVNYLISAGVTSAFSTVLGNGGKITKSGAKGFVYNGKLYL